MARGHALDHGIDRFEVAGVGRERHPHGRARGCDVRAGRADVVLDVARPLYRGRVERAFELAEDLVVALADDVDEDVESTAVRGSEHDLVQAAVGGGGEQRVEHRDERFGALEAEPLLAEILLLQEALERLRGVEAVQDAVLDGGVRRHGGRLDPRLDPLLVLGILHVHELDPDGAGVRVPQDTEDVAQRHRSTVAAPGTERAHGELAIEVPDAEAVVVDVELGMGVGLAPPERVEVGQQVPTHAVHVDELVDVDDLLVERGFVVERTDVGGPAGRLVGHGEALEDRVVEVVLSEQEVVDRARNSPLSAPWITRWS